MSVEFTGESGEAGQCYSQADVDRHMEEAKDHLGKFVFHSAASGVSFGKSTITGAIIGGVEVFKFGPEHLIDACKHYNEAKRIEHIINGTTPIIKYDGPIIK